MFPAWTEAEKQLAVKHGAAFIALTMVHGAISEGSSQAKRVMDDLLL